MRSRGVLVVLSLLASGLTAAPAAAAKGKTAKQKKVAAQKRAAGKKKPVASKDKAGPGSLGATRHSTSEAGDGSEALAHSRTSATSSTTPRTRTRPAQRQSRTAARPQQRPHETVAPIVTASTTRPAFDTSAARAPKKKGRIKRFFAGVAIAAALSFGAVGWQAADMNSKVSDAWSFITTQISQVWDGGGGGGSQTPEPPHSDPGPPLPPSDPGPSDPGNTDPPQQDPGNQTPSPSGGHGKQTPHGPETDRSR
jgi:hypothetical protein